jgi:Tfp pilus assembly protein PilF
MKFFRFCFYFCLLLLLSGCLASSSALKVSSAERAQMELEAQLARNSFQQGNYAEAEKRLVPLCEKQSIDQPLYQFELASVYLLDGKKEEAHQTLLAAHQSIEGFFDEHSEQSAASLWGKEADKVFKGEPYERSTLYFLLALSFLERNNPDNALAALKTGLLADSDTEKESYKSDFGLLQLLAAKVYDLRGEPELRDQMLTAAFHSLTSFPATTHLFAYKLVQEYLSRKQKHTLNLPPSLVLARTCALTSAQNIERWLRKNKFSPERAQDVALWAEKTTRDINPLDYNALAIIWRGTAPQAVRAGEYGELRLIQPGKVNPDIHYTIAADSTSYSPFTGFGNINYQATTRGGREMDNVLGKQASFKGAANTGGNVLLTTGSVGTGSSGADAILLASGLLLKVLSATTHPEADVRYWHNIPARFEIVPLKLAPINHTLQLIEAGHPQEDMYEPFSWTISTEAPLNVLHLRSDLKGEEAVTSGEVDHSIFYLFMIAHPDEVDLDHDGHISAEEKESARTKILERYDSDGNQELSPEEKNQLLEDAAAVLNRSQ